MICPKCGKEAWAVTVTRTKSVIPGVEGAYRRGNGWAKDYHYTDYRHYAGSKKMVSIKLVQAVMQEVFASPEWASPEWESLRLVVYKALVNKAGSKVLHHYESQTRL
jgi:hypothetical protein